jgi:hypothetical protein
MNNLTKLMFVLILCSAAASATLAHNKVVVVPLGGTDTSCRDGVLNAGEEVDSAVSQFSTLKINDATCRYDFSKVTQLYCQGTCSWAGSEDCQEADADVFCQLKLDTPNAFALSFDIVAATDDPGFACPKIGLGESFNADISSRTGDLGFVPRFEDNSVLGSHAAGDTIQNVVCDISD